MFYKALAPGGIGHKVPFLEAAPLAPCRTLKSSA